MTAAMPQAIPQAIPQVDRAPAWHPATRVAFRFCFVYFGLYALMTQMLESYVPIPGIHLPDLAVLPPARPLLLWIGHHVLRVAVPASPPRTASGDTMFGWIVFWYLLVIATVVTLIWSVVARRRTEHHRLFAWFRLFLRIGVGSAFLVYGFAKVIPDQMPTLWLTRLVEPFGNFSPFGVLWASIGASPVYEIVLGCAEVLGGLMLFFPATTLVGTCVCLMDAAMVFLMNMTYDLDVKLFSFHLVVMSLFLLAPYARPLFDLAVLHRAGSLPPEPPVGGSASAWRKLVIAQAVFCIYTVLLIVPSELHTWWTVGGGAPRSPLFGIWEVDSMTVDGALKAPLLSDSTRGVG